MSSVAGRAGAGFTMGRDIVQLEPSTPSQAQRGWSSSERDKQVGQLQPRLDGHIASRKAGTDAALRKAFFHLAEIDWINFKDSQGDCFLSSRYYTTSCGSHCARPPRELRARQRDQIPLNDTSRRQSLRHRHRARLLRSSGLRLLRGTNINWPTRRSRRTVSFVASHLCDPRKMGDVKGAG